MMKDENTLLLFHAYILNELQQFSFKIKDRNERFSFYLL